MHFKVIGIGEVLWDLLPSGREMGGAPANFACHARALGADASVITRVGNDSLGWDIRRRLEQRSIANNTVQVDDKAPTGTVTVSLSGNGVPHFLIQEHVAWDRLMLTPEALHAVGEADALCFGTLAQRNESARRTIQGLVAAAPANAIRLFDVNFRQKYFSREVIEQSLRLANVLKCNDSELPILARLLGLAGSVRQQIEQLTRTFDLRLVALTRGPAGSLIFQAGEWSECPSMPIRIVDTVGAGDAFAAALVMGMLHKMQLDEINTLANELACYVCSCVGATPSLPEKFSKRFATHDHVAKVASKKTVAEKSLNPVENED